MVRRRWNVEGSPSVRIIERILRIIELIIGSGVGGTA
jgi:hypothetical protein